MKLTETMSTVKGWDYISAIFSIFRNCLDEKSIDSHIFPRYIYRGITKRYFTESNNILYALLQNRDTCEVEKYSIQRKLESCKDYCFPSTTDNVDACVAEGIKVANGEFDSSIYCLRPDEDQQLYEQRIKSHHIYDCLYKKLLNRTEELVCEASLGNVSQSNIKRESSINDCILCLKNIISLDYYNFTVPEQIRSGASVRLRDTDAKYFSVSDYIRYNKNLITNFKSYNPEYKEYNDLEILAEIQHKGGGTCLVDFSTNFFISLWFACNNDFNDFGYLFCYDVNTDALTQDNITIFNKNRNEETLEDLLLKSRKTTMYAGGDKFRFWLWKPVNQNGRIARQDSVFVFGLEKFYINTHRVDVIPIPPQWKRDILVTLKTFFGITSETVYPDVDGFASSNSKIAKISNDTIYFNPQIKINKIANAGLDLEIIQRGMSCLLKGEYPIALNYFLKSISENHPFYESLRENGTCQINKDYNDLRAKYLLKTEVLYSIGFCYKKIGDNLNASRYLNKAFRLCFGVLTRDTLNEDLSLNLAEPTTNSFGMIFNSEESTKIILTKMYKITDDYIDVLYDLRKYDTAYNLVDLLIQNAPSLCVRDITIIKRVKECVCLLKEIQKAINSEDLKNISIKSKVPKTSARNNLFSTAIQKYLRLISIIIYNPKIFESEKFLTDKKFNAALDDFKVSVSETNIASMELSNTVWIFSDLTDLINECFKDIKYVSLRNIVKFVTSQIEDAQNSIHSRYKVL